MGYFAKGIEVRNFSDLHKALVEAQVALDFSLTFSTCYELLLPWPLLHFHP